MADTFQWQRCNSDGTGCVDISGQTGTTYVIVSDDVGKRIRCRGSRNSIAVTDSDLTSIITVSAPSDTFASKTAWVDDPIGISPLRTLTCSSFSELTSAIGSMQPGDKIDASSISLSSYTGEFTISQKGGTAAHPVEIIVGPNARFSYNGGANLPAIYLDRCSHMRFDNSGTVTTNSNGGHGINQVNCHDLELFQRGKVFDCGGNGFYPASRGSGQFLTHPTNGNPVGGYANKLYFGEITNCGLAYNIAGRDPHSIKGTGLHGVQFADSTYALWDTVMAAKVHDQPTGAAIQIGGSSSNGVNDGVQSCTFIIDAEDITNYVNAPYGNGSAIQFWGVRVNNNTVEFLRAKNCAGRAVNNEGAASLGTDTLSWGQAENCCYKMAGGTDPFDTRGGLVYVHKEVV